MATTTTSTNITIDSNSIQNTISNATTTATATTYNLFGTTSAIDYTHNSIGTAVATNSPSTTMNDYINYWCEQQNNNNNIKKEENKKMTNNEFNFGPYNNQNIRLSPYGIAIKNKTGKWVSYDKNTERIIDVNIFNIEIDPTKIFYKLPKALKDIEPGNLIIHNNTLMFVESVMSNRIAAIDPVEGIEKTILPAISPFHFDYIPVIISLTDYMPEATEENPFGNLLPFMMMGNNTNSLIPILLTSGGDFSNIDPMLLLAASGDNSFLMLQLMMKNKKKDDNNKKEALKKAIQESQKRKKNINIDLTNEEKIFTNIHKEINNKDRDF